MCTCNNCEGSGWLRYWRRSVSEPNGYHEEQGACSCNPEEEPLAEHSDKECIRDVTLESTAGLW